MKKILITGATGFLGRSLIGRLKKEHQEAALYTLVRPSSDTSFLSLNKVEWVIYDGNFESLNKLFFDKKIDLVIHLATHYAFDHKSNDIENFVESNIRFGFNLLEAASLNGCLKFINTGSYIQNLFSDVFYPSCLYAVTKQTMENAVSLYANNFNIRAITLRLYDTYGENDNRRKILNLLKESQANDLQLKMSPGEQEVRLVYIDDVVNAFMGAIEVLNNSEAFDHQVYYVAGKPYTLKEIARIFEEVSERALDIDWGAIPYRKYQPMQSYTGKILPNWRAEVNLHEGIKRILNK